MEQHPERHWREVLFLCDEYHSFATVGEQDPSGDEKFFSLSRQARCIPIVATQSVSSFRSTLPGESSSLFSMERKHTSESADDPWRSASDTSPAAAATDVSSVTRNENSLAWIIRMRIEPPSPARSLPTDDA